MGYSDKKINTIHTCGVLSYGRDFDAVFLLKNVLWEEVLLTCEYHIVLEPECSSVRIQAVVAR